MDSTPSTPGQSNASTGGGGGQAFEQERRELQDIGSQASDALQSAKQKTSEAAGSAAQSAKDVARQVKHQATDATQKAFSQLKDHGQRVVSEQKDRTASTLSDVGNALHKAAERLRQDKDDNIASYVDALAGLSDRAGGYLRDANVSGLVGDVQQAARRNPGLFLGGMFLAGLAVARFAKASRPESYRREGDYRRPMGGSGSPYDWPGEYEGRRFAGPGNHHQPHTYTDPDEYPGARAASHTDAPDLGMSGVATGGSSTTTLGAGGSVSGVGSTYDSSSMSSNPATPARPAPSGPGTTPSGSTEVRDV